MNKRQFLALAAGTLLLGAAPLMAQPQQRVSPIDVTASNFEGSRVTIYYSRPYTKDPKTGAPRKIWGGLVPFDKVWRMGANEATLMVTQHPIELGGVTVPAGAASLHFLPMADGTAKLIVNKQIGQWGGQHDEKLDYVRVDTKAEPLEKSVDQFTINVAKNAAAGPLAGTIRLSWENTAYSIPFTVKK